jgi:hypothetical protein
MPGSPGTPPSPDPLPAPRLALVVATGTYGDPGLRRLRAPARDAADLAQVLADPGIGGFTVTTVIDQPAQQIRLAIEDFLDGRGTGDLLLVYLSCHGLLDARRRLYFAAADTRKDRLGATGVEAAWVLDQLEHCRARRQVLILDSCFSGAFAHGAKGEADLGLQDRFIGQGRGRVVLTASTATEYSFEGDPTGAASPAGSVFTAALVHGLRTGAADTDHDGLVSVDDAYAYVFDQVQARGAAQTPQRWLYGAEGQILLARNPAGPTITPAALPESLRAGLESPHPGIRIGAVTELGEWLAGGDPARAATALRHLQEVADTDIPRVATTARTLLGTRTGAGPPAPALPQAATPAPRPPARPRTVIEVAIEPGGAPGTFRVQVAASPVGEALVTVELEADALLARRELLQQAVLASAAPSRQVLPETDQPVREAGEMLFTALLGTQDAGRLYRTATARAAERGERLQVALQLNTPELAQLPWEAMYDRATRAYVCRQGQLVRYVPAASMPAPLQVRPPLRILGVVSSPRGLSPLDVDKEQAQLARALAGLASQGLTELHWAPSATWEDLQDLLQDEWHVLHFIGHGDFDPRRDKGVLMLQRDDAPVAAHRLADLLRQARPMPRLVVLNSCSGAAAGASGLFSGTAAALARGGVSAVAAMQYEISDPAAAAFARAFYTAIAHGRDVDDAVSSGRGAILELSNRTLEWLTPVLYLRGHDTRLFTLPAPAGLVPEPTPSARPASQRDTNTAHQSPPPADAHPIEFTTWLAEQWQHASREPSPAKRPSITVSQLINSASRSEQRPGWFQEAAQAPSPEPDNAIVQRRAAEIARSPNAGTDFDNWLLAVIELKIQQRATEIARSPDAGTDHDNWLRAERELKVALRAAEISRSPQARTDYDNWLRAEQETDAGNSAAPPDGSR